MSVRKPIHHHIHAARRREKRREYIDYALVILFLALLVFAISVHLKSQKEKRLFESEARSAALRAFEMERELNKERKQKIVSSPDNSLQETQVTHNDAQSTSTQSVALRDEQTTSNADENVPNATSGGDESVSNASTMQLSPYPKYEDVTAVRYENSRLGFVMELPQQWSLIYERGEDVVFSDEQVPFGSSLEDIVGRPGAMWMHIARPCAPTEATGTIFQFSTSSDNLVRDSTSCIAPFMVTLGYRADVPDARERETFLLSLGRTFSPIVSPNAPYAPIR